MDRQTLKNTILTITKEELNKYGKYTCTESCVEKINKNKECIIIKKTDDESGVGAVLYYDDILERLDEDDDVIKITEEISDCVSTIIDKFNELNCGIKIPHFTYDFIKENALVKIINKEKNESLLTKVPHKNFLDLSIICYIETKVKDSDGSININYEIMEMGNMPVAELFDYAIENTKNKYPIKVQSLAEMLGMTDELMEGDNFLVARTNPNAYGAAAMLFLNQIYRFDEDYFIIPSSTHEILLVKRDDAEIGRFKQMIKDVNTTEVSENDFLSNSLYLFEHKTGVISIIE